MTDLKFVSTAARQTVIAAAVRNAAIKHEKHEHVPIALRSPIRGPLRCAVSILRLALLRTAHASLQSKQTVGLSYIVEAT